MSSARPGRFLRGGERIGAVLVGTIGALENAEIDQVPDADREEGDGENPVERAPLQHVAHEAEKRQQQIQQADCRGDQAIHSWLVPILKPLRRQRIEGIESSDANYEIDQAPKEVETENREDDPLQDD